MRNFSSLGGKLPGIKSYTGISVSLYHGHARLLAARPSSLGSENCGMSYPSIFQLTETSHLMLPRLPPGSYTPCQFCEKNRLPAGLIARMTCKELVTGILYGTIYI